MNKNLGHLMAKDRREDDRVASRNGPKLEQIDEETTKNT